MGALDERGQGWARAGLFKAGTASAQLVDASGATADGNRAAFHAGITVSERVAATSQPTPMSPHRKPQMNSQLRRTRLEPTKAWDRAKCSTPADWAHDDPNPKTTERPWPEPVDALATAAARRPEPAAAVSTEIAFVVRL